MYPHVTRTPLTAVVHMRHADQESLCRQFVRLQEFYESPYPEIQGCYFTLDKFKERYSRDNGGVFTYYTDWHGFNVPGHVVNEFHAKFGSDLSDDELALAREVHGLDQFYLIGSHEGDKAEDALKHELVHASYYLDPDYKDKVDELVGNWKVTVQAKRLMTLLKSWGYSDRTMDDELNAYMATTDEAWWRKETKDTIFSQQLWEDGYDFRHLAQRCRTDRWLPDG